MSRFSSSLKLYWLLVLILAALGGLNPFLPQGSVTMVSSQELPASKPVVALVSAFTLLCVYGGLGLLGRKLTHLLSWPDLLSDQVTDRQRFVIPALAGIGMAIFFVVVDGVMSSWHALGPLMHPPFPTSIVASIVAAIGEELIFRLLLVSFWCWLLGRVLLRGNAGEPVFWVVATLSALAFAAGHVPGVMYAYGFETLAEMPIALLAEIVLLNGALSFFAAWYLRRYGYLAAVSIHLWTDLVWHVVWGLVG